MNDDARSARIIKEDAAAGRILEYAAKQAAYEAARRAWHEHLAGLAEKARREAGE